MDEQRHLCAFYGSLRRVQYNSSEVNPDFLYLSTTTIGGYKMYSLRAYPACIISDDPEDTIVIELFDLDARNFASIDSMEKGAGYHTTTIIVDGKEYIMYLHTPEHWEGREDRLVANGDWVEHKRN